MEKKEGTSQVKWRLTRGGKRKQKKENNSEKVRSEVEGKIDNR